jgi:transposase
MGETVRELKACPFCGATAQLFSQISRKLVFCVVCEVATCGYVHAVDAIAAWNRRAAAPPRPPPPSSSSACRYVSIRA